MKKITLHHLIGPELKNIKKNFCHVIVNYLQVVFTGYFSGLFNRYHRKNLPIKRYVNDEVKLQKALLETKVFRYHQLAPETVSTIYH
jgi:hypothetical protein